MTTTEFNEPTGMFEKNVLHPYTKQPLEPSLDAIKCNAIPSVGVMFCNRVTPMSVELKKIMWYVLLIFCIGMLFTFNVKVYISDFSFGSDDALLSYFPSFLVILSGCVIGYVLGSKRRGK